MSEQTIDRFKVVAFTYSITDETGKPVEQSDIPMEYIHGSDHNQMFPKVEAALAGKRVGDSVDVTLSPGEGFGPHDPNLTFTDDLDNVPLEFRYVGARPTFTNDHGEEMQLLVTRIENGQITVDANHPFAGKTITFHITVQGIREAKAAEIGGGVPQGIPNLH